MKIAKIQVFCKNQKNFGFLKKKMLVIVILIVKETFFSFRPYQPDVRHHL